MDTSFLAGGIADQVVQARVSSGDVVAALPPPPMAVVPAAVTTLVAASGVAWVLASAMKHMGKYVVFLHAKGPAPHPEADYLWVGPVNKQCYACTVAGCGMRANSRNTILKNLHTLHWNTHFWCMAGKKLKGDMPNAMGKHYKICKYCQP